MQIGAAETRSTWGQGAAIGTVWSADTADGISALGVSPTPRNPPPYYPPHPAYFDEARPRRRPAPWMITQPNGAAHAADPEFGLTASSKREPPSLHRQPLSESLRYETSHEAPSRAVGIRRAMPAIGGPPVPQVSSHLRPIGPTELRPGRGGRRARSPAAYVSAVTVLGRAGAGSGVAPRAFGGSRSSPIHRIA